MAFWPFRKAKPAWLSHPLAPRDGVLICEKALLDDGRPHYVELSESGSGFLVLVVCHKGDVRCFLATCPHRDIPMSQAGAHALFGKGEVHCAHHGQPSPLWDGKVQFGPLQRREITRGRPAYRR